MPRRAANASAPFKWYDVYPRCSPAMFGRPIVIAWAAAALVPLRARAQDDPLVRPYPADRCPSCAEWNAPRGPVHLFGNTYYVGTRGLASVLIASSEGHVLIDGGLPNSAPIVLANIRALGFDPSHVQLILNSHAHYDHAGGIAALQRATGARVAARPASALVLERGAPGPDDPQYGSALDLPPVPAVETLADGRTVQVGAVTLTAHATGGHTPGGTSWSWRSCEGERCLDFVYADSQTPVSRDGFRFSDDGAYPTALTDFERGFALLERLPCDVLITPHPGASALWERLAAGPEGLVDPDACSRYVAKGREQLRQRLEREKQ